MCERFQEVADGSKCVEMQYCRYCRSQTELVCVTAEESKGRVAFVDEVRGQPRPY